MSKRHSVHTRVSRGLRMLTFGFHGTTPLDEAAACPSAEPEVVGEVDFTETEDGGEEAGVLVAAIRALFIG